MQITESNKEEVSGAEIIRCSSFAYVGKCIKDSLKVCISVKSNQNSQCHLHYNPRVRFSSGVTFLFLLPPFVKETFVFALSSSISLLLLLYYFYYILHRPSRTVNCAVVAFSFVIQFPFEFYKFNAKITIDLEFFFHFMKFPE